MALPFMRRHEDLSDWLPWLIPLTTDNEVILTAAGGLLRVIKIMPPDFETASPDELVQHCDRVSAALARLGNGWSITIDQWRTHESAYVRTVPFGGNLAAQLVDNSRRKQFTGSVGQVFKNDTFLAIHYLPQARDAFLNWMMDRPGNTSQANIDFFLEHSGDLITELAQTMREVIVLRGPSLASYLKATVTFEPGPAMWPQDVIRCALATREWRTDPSLSIDNRHIATTEVRNYGTPSPLTVEMLHEAPFEMRWVVTLHGLGPEERRREIREQRKRWQAKQRGGMSLLISALTRNPHAGRTNPEVDMALAQLDLMERDLATAPFALSHFNVHTWSDISPDKAYEQAALIAGRLKGQGLDARVATLNNVHAVLADMPGNVDQRTMNLRRARLEIATIARVAPVTGVNVGHREDWRFDGPALLVGNTRRGVPLYFSMNPPGSDRAHTVIVGQTGAGKSSLIGLMSAQFLKYEGARVMVFDRGRSFMVPCHALGGDWIELGSGGYGVQPMRSVHLPAERAWAHNWLLHALEIQGMEKQPHTDAAVKDALGHLADLAPDERTLSRLYSFLAGDDRARQALKVYLAGGTYGDLFDGVVSSYGEAAVMGVETQGILQLESVASLVVSAMFRAVRRDRFVGNAPKLVVIDEAWSLLRHPLFAGEIESWAREMRKLRGALCLATQSLSDLQGTAAVVFEQVANSIFLPNAEAMRPDNAELYKGAGLSEEQIRALAGAMPKQEYLLQTPEVTRLISLRLVDEALRLCAASSPLDHARCTELVANGVEPGTDFTREWLRETTSEWAAAQRQERQLALVA